MVRMTKFTMATEVPMNAAKIKVPAVVKSGIRPVVLHSMKLGNRPVTMVKSVVIKPKTNVAIAALVGFGNLAYWLRKKSFTCLVYQA